MAGNENSGNGLPFRLSEGQLRDRIDEFRAVFGGGSRGMVTWARFCAFLGYSEAEVRECYLRGKEGKNAYTGRAEILGRFATECKAMVAETAEAVSLARDEIARDPLKPEGKGDAPPEIRILAGNGDGRWLDIFQ